MNEVEAKSLIDIYLTVGCQWKCDTCPIGKYNCTRLNKIKQDIIFMSNKIALDSKIEKF